ncbi:MAG: hypothetical protein NUV51_06670 [Sulfuricaulis sp.]|nr:hypothetical protein [Sulfuricaulis sp.]
MRRDIPGRGGQQRGFALVAAIFIVTVLAILGIMMVTIGGMQRATTSAAVQGARAYHAARTGLEWGAYRAVVDASCVASTSISLASIPGLDGFSVTVQCASSQHREGGNTYNIYVVTSIAQSGTFGQADFTSRRMQISVTNAPPPP